MAIYSQKYKITFDDVNENLELKNISLMKYLVDAAGMHSENVRLWSFNYERNKYCFSSYSMECKSY